MARDLRTSIQNYPDRCYYYASTAVQNNKLVPDAKPLGRFNKNDIVPFAWKRLTINGVLTSTRQLIGTIITPDECHDIRPGMFVIDSHNMLYVVDEIPKDDDENRSKEVGTRPVHVLTIVLRGFEAHD